MAAPSPPREPQGQQPADKKRPAPLIGSEGSAAIRRLISASPSPRSFFSSFHSQYQTPLTASSIGLANIMDIKTATLNKYILDQTVSALLSSIPSLPRPRLLALLDSSFASLCVPELAAVPQRALEELIKQGKKPKKYLRALSQSPALLAACPCRVRSAVFDIDSSCSIGHAEAAANAWAKQRKHIFALFMEPKYASFSRSPIPPRPSSLLSSSLSSSILRSPCPLLQALSVVAYEQTIYKQFTDTIRLQYANTGDSSLCAARWECALVVSAASRESSDSPVSYIGLVQDPLAELAALIEEIIFKEADHQTYGILQGESLDRVSSLVHSLLSAPAVCVDVLFVLSAPLLRHWLAASLVACVKDIIENEAIPNDSVPLHKLTELALLGCLPCAAFKSGADPSPSPLSPPDNLFSSFYPCLAELILLSLLGDADEPLSAAFLEQQFINTSPLMRSLILYLLISSIHSGDLTRARQLAEVARGVAINEENREEMRLFMMNLMRACESAQGEVEEAGAALVVALCEKDVWLHYFVLSALSQAGWRVGSINADAIEATGCRERAEEIMHEDKSLSDRFAALYSDWRAAQPALAAATEGDAAVDQEENFES